MNDWKTVSLQDTAPQPWRNGGGSTVELLVWPAGASSSEWQLRLSVALIERNGPFSSFPGIWRWFTVLEGSGVRLTAPGLDALVTADSEALAFDGALAPQAQLVSGPTRDLNLMIRGGPASGAMHRAASQTPWVSQRRWRGIFTDEPSTLKAANGTALELPAGSLTWQHTATAQPLTWRGGGAAWWIEADVS